MLSPSPFPVRRPRPPRSQRQYRKGRRSAEGITSQVVLARGAVPAAVANLSEGGACLALRRAVAKGERLLLRLFNGHCLHCVTAEARVSWCERDGAVYRVGCQFLSPLRLADLLPLLS
jgi:hypothetical protein